ncbi:tissue factor pathway inhibitor 2 isoform X2 [Pelobates cultripes]|uniref:Tissue factor pathway inhibitor n=1 Tax=Pelobates cultripes TaxID=61616 RepID=A0AAD1RYT7_PELCU|nr:tissue factor pathway inhibitor 2 isoform X2 [Pelobates cultripes]
MLFSSMWALAIFYLLQLVIGTPVQNAERIATNNSSICLLPPDEGPCHALLPRYYYDRFTQTCQEFSWGGCDGNENNFMYQEDCEKTCWKIKKVPKICRMEASTGPCRGLFKKYAFNLLTMKCEIFYYGGCYGNDNRFRDEASCLEHCAPKRNAPSFCYSPKDEGSCSATVTRYYFNIETKACEEFVYTGCGGNSNNFVKIEDCNSVCKQGNKKPKNKVRKLRVRFES